MNRQIRIIGQAVVILGLISGGWGLHWLLGPEFAGNRFATFYIPVTLAALLGGFRGGALATALAAISVLYFAFPRLPSMTRLDAEALLVFVSTGLLISAVVQYALHQRQQRRLAEEVHWGTSTESD